MHALDSRYLNLTNYFAHRFTTAGTFSYGLSPLPSFLVEPDRAEDELSIVVRPERGAEQQQHDVVVSRGDDDATARPGRLEIALGDVVGWSTDGTLTTGFAGPLLYHRRCRHPGSGGRRVDRPASVRRRAAR
jgi:hypothetical protein